MEAGGGVSEGVGGWYHHPPYDQDVCRIIIKMKWMMTQVKIMMIILE